MDLKSLYSCEMFSDPEFKPSPTFSVKQGELLVQGRRNDGKHLFEKTVIEYECRWKKQKDWNADRPTIVIPIRNNVGLLKYTSANLRKHDISEMCNVIIVDDRSTEDIKQVALKEGFSYLRVDNTKGFNFSMLNNIAAKIAHFYGSREMICWNSDLWCVKKEYFVELLRRHREASAKVSGSKLVYPPRDISFYSDSMGDNENIKKYYQHKRGQWRETVQFGGDFWAIRFPRGVPPTLSPDHYLRFGDISDPRVNCDRGASFVTAALHVWDLDFFISIGGFNPSLAKNFQDVDICLKVLDNGEYPMYFGKDIYFHHDESFNFFNNGSEKKEGPQIDSDYVLFGKVWLDSILQLAMGFPTKDEVDAQTLAANKLEQGAQ